MTRVSDSTLYGNEYLITDVLSDLTAAIFEADSTGNVNTFRQNLQVDYVDRLIDIVGVNGGSGYDNLSKAAALSNLRRIERMAKSRSGGDSQTQAHAEYLAYLIESALETS